MFADARGLRQMQGSRAVKETDRQIRALYDDRTIRVYQAYSDTIADAALSHQTFAPPFKMDRMTWIKPSFLWMMYRSGWGFKDAGQARILAIDITREGFEWALAHGCPSHLETPMTRGEWEAWKQRCPVRIQWDPDRDLHLRPLECRAIQIGLAGESVRRYVDEWIQRIEDVTGIAHRIRQLVADADAETASRLLPEERTYPTPWESLISPRAGVSASARRLLPTQRFGGLGKGSLLR
jgi:hypothetical protein